MNSSPNAQSALLTTLAEAFQKIQDPRDPRGVRHDFQGMVILIFLGLLARISKIAHIQRWAKKHWHALYAPLGFKRMLPPDETTFSRNLARVDVQQFQDAFAEFLKLLLSEKTDSLTAAIDGKVAKQMPDKNDDPLYMLNIFVHDIKVTLQQYSVRGDKTNEPGCLKKHLEKLFDTYPALKLLTGDAIFAQRPLLEALAEHECDYLFQVKENQGRVLEQMTLVFEEAPQQEPSDIHRSKKREMLKFVVST
jgi:hypothetical protein